MWGTQQGIHAPGLDMCPVPRGAVALIERMNGTQLSLHQRLDHWHTPPTPPLPTSRYLFVTVATGLWGGLLIGLQTEYFTSNRYKPVQVGVVCQVDCQPDSRHLGTLEVLPRAAWWHQQLACSPTMSVSHWVGPLDNAAYAQRIIHVPHYVLRLQQTNPNGTDWLPSNSDAILHRMLLTPAAPALPLTSSLAWLWATSHASSQPSPSASLSTPVSQGSV
jgi:hypothetical protein